MLNFKIYKNIWYYVLHTTIFYIYICIRKYSVMDSQNNKSQQTLSGLIHISTFSKYLIPLGNFIFPLIIWTIGKNNRLIDHHGKQAINFQLSIFFYMVLVAGCALAGILITGLSSSMGDFSLPQDIVRLINIPEAFPILIILTISAVLLLGLFILEIFFVIAATVAASEGKFYKYPLKINFISSTQETEEQSTKNATI